MPIALWVVPVPDLGGVARHVIDVARTGIPGWRLVFFTPEGDLAERLRALGAPVLTAPFGPSAGVRASVASLRRIVRTLRPKVVHTHLAFADIAGVIATRGLPVSLVSTEHGIAADDTIYHGSRLRATVMAGVHTVRLRAFDGVIAVSNATRDAMRTKWRARLPIAVIPNGIDPVTSTRATPPVGTIRVASISRLSPEKRIDCLLAAFATLQHDHPGARLTVAGAGPLERELKVQAVELGLGETVQFPGFVAAPDLLAETDVLVQLSSWENCSYTLLDACAAGVGVVATPVGGNPEILPQECLIDAHDSTALARAMALQAGNPDLRPGLPVGWATVPEMCACMGAVYAGFRP